jgi:hypothetical protein
MEITKDKLQEGRELAKKHGFKKLFLNEKGEFFTDKGLALMSVERNADKVAEVPLAGGGEGEEKGEGKATNDLAKAADVIAAIEAAETHDAVVAILDAESAGKNRKTVIDAGNKRLEAIAEAAQSPKDNVTIEAIEAETDQKAVEALLNLEKAGKNRPEVISAAEKKLETFKKAE